MDETQIGKYLKVVKLARNPNKITDTWQVFSMIDAHLGTIKWFSNWRQYCFFPVADTVFNFWCLDDISKFITVQMNARKQS